MYSDLLRYIFMALCPNNYEYCTRFLRALQHWKANFQEVRSANITITSTFLEWSGEVQWSRIPIVKMINLSLYYSILPKGSRTCTGLIVNLHWKLSRLQWKYSSPKNVVFSVAVPFWAYQGARGKIYTSKDYSIENLCLSTHRKPPWYDLFLCHLPLLSV